MRPSGATAAVAALALLGLACAEPTAPAAEFQWANGGSCNSDAPAVPLTRAQLDSLGPRSYDATIGGNWALIAAAVPGGWGGLYYDNDVLVVRLVDTTRLAAALDTLRNYGLTVPADRRDVVAQPSRWTYLQLYDWSSYVLYQVTASLAWAQSIDPVGNRLQLSTLSAGARDSLLAALRAVPIPCWLAVVNVDPQAAGAP